MEVAIRDLEKLDGAAWIAKYHGLGRLRLERKGDDLRIIGTDNYVCVDCYTSSCDFVDWPDGEGIQFSGEAKLKAIRRIIEKGYGGVARPLMLTMEEYNVAVLNRNALGFMTKSMRISTDEGNVLDIDKLQNVQDEDNDGTLLVMNTMWNAIGKLAVKCGVGNWRLVTHGPLKVFELRNQDGKSRIYAMPLKG